MAILSSIGTLFTDVHMIIILIITQGNHLVVRTHQRSVLSHAITTTVDHCLFKDLIQNLLVQ